MDNPIFNFFLGRKKEVVAIRRHLLPLVIQSFLTAFWVWVTIFVVALIVNLVAILITYLKGEKIKIFEFFSPNLVWGLLIVLGALFVYQSLSTVALKIMTLHAYANKFTTNDISVDIISFPSDYIVAYGISVKNNKLFKLENLVIKIIKYEIGKKDRTPYHLYPASLAWLDDRTFIWSGIDLDRSLERVAALFYLSEYQGNISLDIPGPDGQPSNNKAMGDFGTGEGVMFADFEVSCSIDGYKLMKSTRIRVEIDGKITKVEIVKEKH